MIAEIEVPVDSLRKNQNKKVRGMESGDIVIGRMGRRMRVLNCNEWVIVRDKATGPYCRLQATDDQSVIVIWPRSWYCKPGESLELNFQ